MNKVRVAIVGNGNLGRWHCEKADQIANIDFVALVDICPQARFRAKELYPYIETVEEAKEVIDQIDAAIVVTPISTHHSLIKYFLEHDKHVFCEKSATETLDQILEIEKILAKKENLVFQVGHSERYHQIWSEMAPYQEFIEMPYSSVRINRYGPYRGRDADVSVVEDLLIHDVDLILNLFKEEPSSVTARGYKIRSDKWDHVNVLFEYKSGRKIAISTGRNHVEVVRNFEMINEAGCMKIDFLNNKFLFASNSSEVSAIDYPKRDHLYLEQIDFINSILNEEAAVIGFDDAKRAICVLNSVLTSLKSNQTVTIK